MSGIKYDGGKNRLELLPTELIEEVGKVLTFGAQKYEAENWRKFKPEDHKRLIGATMRHIEEYRKGIYYDEESGLPHLAHAATNLGFLLHLSKPYDTWLALNNLIAKLKAYYTGLNKPSAIFAVARGGLVPATYIAHALGVKLVTSKLSDLVGDILIVDDISDSGETIKEVLAYCSNSEVYNDIKVATIFERYNTKVKPAFSGQVVTTDEWIKFPWEVENVAD